MWWSFKSQRDTYHLVWSSAYYQWVQSEKRLAVFCALTFTAEVITGCQQQSAVQFDHQLLVCSRRTAIV